MTKKIEFKNSKIDRVLHHFQLLLEREKGITLKLVNDKKNYYGDKITFEELLKKLCNMVIGLELVSVVNSILNETFFSFLTYYHQ